MTEYAKHFIPLESNPAVFNQLIWQIGVSESLSFHDVLSIDDADLLSLIPRPVHALVLVFPTSEDYEDLGEKDRTIAAKLHDQSRTPSEDEDILWFKQTIHNACGLYGILHALTNGEARKHIRA